MKLLSLVVLVCAFAFGAISIKAIRNFCGWLVDYYADQLKGYNRDLEIQDARLNIILNACYIVFLLAVSIGSVYVFFTH